MAQRKSRFKKGSAAARAFMAKLRSMQGGRKMSISKMTKTERKTSGRKAAKKRSSFTNPRPTTSTEMKLNKLRNKGRQIAREAGIKPFFFTGRKPQIVVSEGEFGMAKRRRSRKARKSTSYSGKAHRRIRYHGGRKTRRTRRHALLGGIGGQGIVPMLTQGAIGAAGAIGSAFIASKIPGVPSKVKPIIPFAVAIALLTLGKKIPMSKTLAFGCAVAGAMGLVKQFAPTIPLLAGVDSAPELSADEVGLLGATQYTGAVQELTGAISPADL